MVGIGDLCERVISTGAYTFDDILTPGEPNRGRFWRLERDRDDGEGSAWVEQPVAGRVGEYGLTFPRLAELLAAQSRRRRRDLREFARVIHLATTDPKAIDKQLPALDGERMTPDLSAMDPDDWPIGAPHTHMPESTVEPARDDDEDAAWLAASKAQWGP